MLAELQQETSVHIDNLLSKKTAAQELEEKINQVQQELLTTNANRTDNAQKRDDRIRILTTTLEQLRKEDAAEGKDIAEAVMGMSVLMNSLGGEFEKLNVPAPEEKKILDAAERRVKSAEFSLHEASKKWAVMGIRKRAEAAAEIELTSAKTAQQTAISEVGKMARHRLQDASLAESMQTLKMMISKTLTLAEERHKTTAKQLQIVSARKKEAFKIKEEAAQALEKLTAELSGLEIDLQAAEDELSLLTNGSQEYVAKENEISTLRQKVEETRGNRTTVETIYMSKENFASELQTHEIATRKIFDNQKIWIAKIKSDSEEREITFVNRLEAMKAMSDLDVMQNQNNVAVALDLKNASFMATAASVVDRQRMEMMEGHPAQLAALEKIRAGQAEAIAEIRRREDVLLQGFASRWGIDPLTGSIYDHGADAGLSATAENPAS